MTTAKITTNILVIMKSEMRFHSLKQDFIGKVSSQRQQNKTKKNTAQKNKKKTPKCVHTKMCWRWLLMPSCFVLVWKVTWPEKQQPKDFRLFSQKGREDRPCVMLFCVFFFLSELSEGKKEHSTRGPHRLNHMGSGTSQQSLLMEPQPVLVHGNHSSLPLTLWPSEHSDMRDATLKTPPALTPHPYFLPSFRLWLRVEDFDLGPPAFLGFSCYLSILDTIPKPKKGDQGEIRWHD